MSITINDYLSKNAPDKYNGISHSYEMESSTGLKVVILNYGALIANLYIPDSSGNMADVVLGLDGLDSYMESDANHGSIVGRSANRISGAKFNIDGVQYNVPLNDGVNNLHGGSPSFANVFWDAKVISKEDADKFVKSSNISNIAEVDGESLLLSYTSLDGAAGFPGNLKTKVLYAWLTDNTLLIVYQGVSDKKTIFAPTNHAYFNLRGHDSGKLLDHLLLIDADKVTVKNQHNCTNGEFMDVADTIFDFREVNPVSKFLDDSNEQIKMSMGVDQNFCLNNSQEGDKLAFAASLCDPISNRIMEVYTNMPGLQVYTGNHLEGTNGAKDNAKYEQYGAICLEAQLYPNAVNISEFKTSVIDKDEVKYYACGYRFNA